MFSDLLPLVDGFVRDESERLSLDDRQAAIALAVARYGQDRPREKVEDVACPGGDTLPLPAGWTVDSELVGAEFPIGESPPAQLSCTLYTAPSGAVFRLGGSLAAGALVRLTYTIPHVVSDTEDSVRPAHREALAAYAAALLLDGLAAAAINNGDSTIQADSTDRRTKSQDYAARARTLRKIYDEAMGRGAGDGSQAGNGAVVAWPARGRLTHGFHRR